MSQVPIGGCVLDWERRKGFLPGSRIIAETAHWYVIGYTKWCTGRGEHQFQAAHRGPTPDA
jgi:hypothetical protein